jgi:hypothetical protein
VLYSHIDMPPPAELHVGQQVEFSFERVTAQDGYQWRALAVRPDGVESGDVREYVTDPQGSFRSTLRLDFDDKGTEGDADPRLSM